MATQMQSSKADYRLETLDGVGPRSIQKLASLGIHTINDLFFHLPYRYEDRTKIRALNRLQLTESAVIQGEISSTAVRFGRKRSLLVKISDGSGFLNIRFFYFSKAQENSFAQGKLIQCYGEVRRGSEGLEMVHPEYLFPAESTNSLLQSHLTSVYHSNEHVPQKFLRKIIRQALTRLEDNILQVNDLMPVDIINSQPLPDLKNAILQLHQPETFQETFTLANHQHPAQVRLILEELLAHHLSMKKLRAAAQAHAAPSFEENSKFQQRFIESLPFTLTAAQQRVIQEVANNLHANIPMLRLVQGDVGSGKTVVAMAAALQAIDSEWQVALMAPTEMLAEQHFQNVKSWAEPLGIKIAWLSGKVKGKPRKTTLEQLANHEIQLIVGTHALFQEDVKYAKLGLIIIDEQHRFGVHQRLALKEKGLHKIVPHQLIMTATPIPRTLAMTAYADLDLSIIDELPKGRQAVDTVVIPETRREQVIQRVREACQSGRQAYWVCPLIEESEALNCQAAELTSQNLQELLPELEIGLVHGRMKAEEKSSVMQRFKKGDINLLVATTVIEVGVDVPNASLMIIENAERLGLSQLHQLRGRVGRGSIKSSCVLMYKGKLSRVGKERLGIMRETNDGFVIAEKDLEIRGPGELLGTKQTGLLQLRVADINRDQALFPLVEDAANMMTKHCPQNITPLINRWLKQGLQYGNV